MADLGRTRMVRVKVGVDYTIGLRFLIAICRSGGFWLGLASGIVGSLLGVMASACYVEPPNPDPSTTSTGTDTDGGESSDSGPGGLDESSGSSSA